VRIGAPVALLGIIVGSVLVRGFIAVRHVAPTFFPDEYIYAAISRSFAEHGRPLIRGGPTHFPALLEPLLAAPLWAVAGVETAYHLVQVENAVFLSLAALPVYGLARRLELGTGWSLFSAVFAVAIPEATFVGYILADPLGYLLALSALYAGVVALQERSGRAGVAFVLLTALATGARVQYVVLVPAFVFASFALERRAAFRVQRWPLGIFGLAIAAAAALGTGRVLGYYSAIMETHLGWSFARWFGLELFFMALASGVVLAPGAVLGLCSTRERRDRAFAALAIPFAVAVLVEAAVYASNGESQRLKERYLMVLMPLIPLAFGLYLKRGRPGRLLIAGLAASIAALAALIPLSGYAAGGSDDSPLLWSVVSLQWQLGISNASLVFAICATIGAALAAMVAWGRLTRPAIAAGVLLMVAVSVGAIRYDLYDAGQIRSHLVASNATWVDDAGLGPVAAVQTDLAPPGALLEQLFWNRSITTELLLGANAPPTDAFRTARLRVARDGTLLVHGRPLRTAFLYQNYQSSPMLEGVRRVGAYGAFTLWQPGGTVRLRTLEVGRYGDGWLGLRGVLRVWPTASRGSVSFTLSLPRKASRPLRIRFGDQTYRLVPGGPGVPVRLQVNGPGPWSTRFADVEGGSVLADNRLASARSTLPVYHPG
jgi:hypothetical protein